MAARGVIGIEEQRRCQIALLNLVRVVSKMGFVTGTWTNSKRGAFFVFLLLFVFFFVNIFATAGIAEQLLVLLTPIRLISA